MVLIAHLTDPHIGPLPRPKLRELASKRLTGYINWRRGRSATHDMAALAAILARPLFAPDRRPAAAGPAARETLPRLTGIIVDRQRRTAVFEAADGGRPLVLAEDGRIAGFVVRRIEPGEVMLDGPGGPRTLRPTFDPAPPRPAASPGTPPGIQPGAGLSSVAFPNLPSAQPVAR